MSVCVRQLLCVLVLAASSSLFWSDPGRAQLQPTAVPQPVPMLRAAYLASNPAQAVKDMKSGELRGAAHDLAQEMSKAMGLPLDFMGLSSPPAVIESVRIGAADIGFVAYEATRIGTVEFSQTYMLVQQTFIVLDGSPVLSVADIDRAGRKIAGTLNDSITLCLRRTLKNATLVELEGKPDVLAKALASGEVDAIGANRQRLTTLTASVPGSRVLPDTFFNVPQTIVVAKDKRDLLVKVESMIDEARNSGLLRDAIVKSGVAGIEPAPKSAGSEHGCPG